MDRWIEYQSAGGVEGIVGDEEKEEEKVAYVEDVPILEDKQWSELEAVVLSDERVNASMKDKQYRLYSHSFVRYLEYSDLPNNSVEPNRWYANIVYIYHEGNDKYMLSALVDVEEKKVVDVLINKYEDIRRDNGDFTTATGYRPGFAIAYYDGSASDIRAFRVRVKAPNSFSALTQSGSLFFGLNATAKNSVISESELCNPSNTTGSYWAQVGLALSGNLATVTWTDTRANCNPQYYQRITYGNSNTYHFIIATVRSDSSYTWNICAINATAGQQECINRSNISQGTFQRSSHSSVWLENQLTTTDWYQSFGSNIKAGYAKYKKVGDSTWYNWDSASKVDKKCNEGAYVRSIVISGSVANGQEATWDLQKMVENYPAC